MFNEEKTRKLKELLDKYISFPSKEEREIEDQEECEVLFENIKSVLQEGANPLVTDDEYENTILVWALLQKDKEFAKELIQRAPSGDALLETASKHEMFKHNTPLVLCIKLGYTDLALALVEKNVDLTTTSEEGLTPFHFASIALGSTYRQIVRTQPEFKRVPGLFAVAPPLPIFMPSEQINIDSVIKEQELIIKLIERGVDPYAVDKLGYTPVNYLEQSFLQEELYKCTDTRIQPKLFAEHFGLSSQDAEDFEKTFVRPFMWGKDVTEGEKKYPEIAKNYRMFVEYQNKKKDLFLEPSDTYLVKLQALNAKYPGKIFEIQKEFDIRTAKDIIEDPKYPEIKSLDDLKNDPNFIIYRQERGGLVGNTPTYFLPEHFYIFRDFEAYCILSRNEYLNTPCHKEFVNKVKLSIELKSQNENVIRFGKSG